MKNLSVMSVIRLLPETTEQANKFANELLSLTTEGEQSALEVDYYLKVFETIIAKVRKHNDFKHCLINEVDLLGNNTFHSAKRVTLQTKSTYDFSACGLWNNLNKKIKSVENIMKSIEADVADVETGELITPAVKKLSEPFIKYDF